MRKIIIRVAIAAVILLAGIGVFQWHNYQQKVEYRKEALLYFKEEDYSKTIFLSWTGVKTSVCICR